LRTNKEIDDKYIRFKECLLKTKSNLNKLVDDVSDVLRRGQPVNKSKKSTSVEVKKSESTDKNDSQVNNENASAVAAAAAVETTGAAPEEEEEEASANNTVEVNNLENGGDQVLESQINENTNSEQLEQNVEDENEETQDEKKMDLSSNDN
jgi:hypothetical protein